MFKNSTFASFCVLYQIFHLNLKLKYMLLDNRGVLKYTFIDLYLTAVCFPFDQALEDSAANAAEEERRRLQTQTELQDRYKMDLEREKMVCHPLSSSLHQHMQWSNFNLNTTSSFWYTVRRL